MASSSGAATFFQELFGGGGEKAAVQEGDTEPGRAVPVPPAPEKPVEDQVKDAKLDYMLSGYKQSEAPSKEEDFAARVTKELKARWFIYALGAFLLFVGAGFVVYGPAALMGTPKSSGMPMLAVNAEGSLKCSALCDAKGETYAETRDPALAPASSAEQHLCAEEGGGPMQRDALCYSKCMGSFKNEVLQEHDATIKVSKESAAEPEAPMRRRRRAQI